MSDLNPPDFKDFEIDADPNKEMRELSRTFGIPWPLVKASLDYFTYVVGLRTGDIIEFHCCEFDEDHVWVTLQDIISHNLFEPEHAMPFPRGIAVRIVDVLWAADAPRG